MMRQCCAWRAVIALGQDTWSNVVERGMASFPWIAHMVFDDIRLGITSSPLDSTRGRTTSGFACNHHPWTTNMVELRWARHAIIALGRTHGQLTSAWHVIIAFGLQILSDDVGRDNCLITFGQHTRSDDVGR